MLRSCCLARARIRSSKDMRGHVDGNFQACQDCCVKVKVENQDSVYFIVPSGELLAGKGDRELKEELDNLKSQGKLKVVVDFSDVPYIDSSILGQLVHGYSELSKRGGGLKLVKPSKRISEVLALTRLDTVFEIFPSRSEAIASWA